MMKKYCLILTVAAMMILASYSASADASRIVSLKPNITELIFALGAGDRLVGVTTWCDKPDAAKNLPRVADYIKPDIEKILAARPDLVVTSEENAIKRPIEILQRSGIEVLILPFGRVDDLIISTRILSEKIGKKEKGGELIKEITEVIARTASEARQDEAISREQPKVLALVGRKPLVAAGTETYIGELIAAAGGKNVIESKAPYPHIDMEQIVATKPDIILDFTMGSEKKNTADGKGEELDISDFRIGPGITEQIAKLKEIFSE